MHTHITRNVTCRQPQASQASGLLRPLGAELRAASQDGVLLGGEGFCCYYSVVSCFCPGRRETRVEAAKIACGDGVIIQRPLLP